MNRSTFDGWQKLAGKIKEMDPHVALGAVNAMIAALEAIKKTIEDKIRREEEHAEKSSTESECIEE